MNVLFSVATDLETAIAVEDAAKRLGLNKSKTIERALKQVYCDGSEENERKLNEPVARV